jgi:tetratricopeptide (TPR) repeat protein
MVKRSYVFAAAFLAAAALAFAGEEPRAPDLFEEALAISKQLDPQTNLDDCRTEWKALLERTRVALKQAAAGEAALTPEQTIGALNKELLIDREVSYISNLYWRDSLFTAALLRKKGNCLATSLLYHLVARELNLPIAIAFAPEHAFARWDDGQTVINIETTNKGKTFPDDVMLVAHELSQADLQPNGFVCKLNAEQIRAQLLNNWAGVMFSLERRKDAFALLEQAQKIAPDSPELQLHELNFLMFEGRIAEAEALVKKMLGRKDAGPWARSSAAFAYAMFLESRGRADEAIQLLRDSYSDAPRGMKLNMIDQLGVLYRHKRDFEKAIHYHKLYTELKPTAESFDQLGSVLTEAHQDAEAIAAYEKALKFNPESFFTRVILAGLYERSGDKKKGREYFAKIEEPREDKITWYCALVWYYANIKEPKLMLENMAAAFKLDGSGQVYHYFVREPDLDAYRKEAEFIELMKTHAPKPGPSDAPPKPAPEKEPAEVRN